MELDDNGARFLFTQWLKRQSTVVKPPVDLAVEGNEVFRGLSHVPVSEQRSPCLYHVFWPEHEQYVFHRSEVSIGRSREREYMGCFGVLHAGQDTLSIVPVLTLDGNVILYLAAAPSSGGVMKTYSFGSFLASCPVT